MVGGTTRIATLFHELAMDTRWVLTSYEPESFLDSVHVLRLSTGTSLMDLFKGVTKLDRHLYIQLGQSFIDFKHPAWRLYHAEELGDFCLKCGVDAENDI